MISLWLQATADGELVELERQCYVGLCCKPGFASQPNLPVTYWVCNAHFLHDLKA